jgi:predicted anti-sigma-YlaC factor YlaD
MDMQPSDLTCKELVELVTEYLENCMAPDERIRFEAHLMVCSGCRTYLEQMRQTIHAMGRLTEESLDPKTRDKLLALFRDWKRSG